MKTNNITKKSFLMTLILAMSAGFSSMKNGGSGAPMAGGGESHFHSHGSFHRTGTLKGWERENRRFNSFNKKGR